MPSQELDSHTWLLAPILDSRCRTLLSSQNVVLDSTVLPHTLQKCGYLKSSVTLLHIWPHIVLLWPTKGIYPPNIFFTLLFDITKSSIFWIRRHWESTFLKASNNSWHKDCSSYWHWGCTLSSPALLKMVNDRTSLPGCRRSYLAGKHITCKFKGEKVLIAHLTNWFLSQFLSVCCRWTAPVFRCDCPPPGGIWLPRQVPMSLIYKFCRLQPAGSGWNSFPFTSSNSNVAFTR